MPDTHLLTAKFARVLDGEIITYLQGNESIAGAGGVRHALAVMSTEDRLAEGILPIVWVAPKPDGRWWREVEPVDVVEPASVDRTWTGIYDRAAHVAAIRDANRREAIRRIDAQEVTGNDRQKFTLLAAMLAKVTLRLAQSFPAEFSDLAADLAPWAKTTQIQAIEAEINALIEMDPDLDLAAAWATREAA